MAELLKNIYNDVFIEKFNKSVSEVKPDFNTSGFTKDIFESNWHQKELKQRMRHIALTLNEHLTPNYEENINLILKMIPVLMKNGFKVDNLEFIFFPDFIEVFGINNYETSIKAIEKVTQFVTCEFAIRPFIIKYPTKTIKQLLKWSSHSSYAVRRLSSEGIRPRLPWAMALPQLKIDPSAIFPILENLKVDKIEYVTRSVANNLNDISKDNPELVIALIKKWIGKNSTTDKLLKHASRTLLKQGNTEVMQLFGFGSVEQIKITKLSTTTPIVKIGNYLEFSFCLRNNNISTSKIRLEYGIYYQKANGALSRKVFKISEKEYLKNSETLITKKQSFKVITTRKFHIGKHQVSVIVNGVELGKIDFELTK